MPIIRRRPSNACIFSDDPTTPSMFWAENERGGTIANSRHDDDSLPAIVAAINTISASLGGTVDFQAGRVFPISDSIDLSGRRAVTLRGQGPGTVIQNNATDGSHAIQAINTVLSDANNNQYIRIQDLNLFGNASSGNGIHFEWVDQVELLGLNVKSHGVNGLYHKGAGMVNGESSHLCANSRFYGNALYGACLEGTHDYLFTTVHFEANGGGCKTEDTYNSSFGNCNFEDNLGMDALLVRANAGVCSLTTVTGGSIEGQASVSASVTNAPQMISFSGVQMDAGKIKSSRGSGTTKYPTAISVQGCVFAANLSYIYLASCRDVAIGGNTFGSEYYPALNPVYVQNTKNFVISNNVIKSYGRGILVGGDSKSSGQVVGNAIYVNPTGTGATNPRGIDVYCGGSEANYLKIDGNLIHPLVATPIPIGINITGGTGIEILDIRDNDIIATTEISCTVATVKFVRNSGSSTGTGSEQTIAHRLAAIPVGCNAWIKYLVGTRYITEMIPFDATNVYPTVETGVTYEWRIE